MNKIRHNIFNISRFCLMFCLLIGTTAHADFERRLNYQGRLVDTNGVPVADNPTASIEFDICTNGSSTANCNSSTIWTETNTVPIVDGLFSSILGENVSIDGINFNSSEYYIQVTYGGNTYTPPQRITAAAMALNVPDGIITSAKMQDGAALDEISDNDGAGSGLDCDLLDGYDWSNVPAGTDIWVNESGDTMSGDLNMGTDGSGKRIIFAATDASNEGGEFVLNGSGANTDWTVDNYAGRLRMHTGGSTYFDLNTSRLTLTGDLYVSGSDIYLPDANTHLIEGAGNSLRVQTADGYVEIGPQNGSYSHFITDLSQFYFNKQIVIAGHDIPYADDTYDLGTNSLKWRNLYIDGTAYLDDISCTDCLNETEIEDIYVLNSGDTMTGALNMSNNNVTNVGHITINDSGANEGLAWNGTAAGWIIDVSPTGRTNADGNLNLYGTANNVMIWRPTIVYEGDDAAEASVQVYGASQGTGRIYVGQSTTYGGGIMYNGDGTPASNTSTDHVSLYRRNNGTDAEVMHWSYSSNNVYFENNIYIGENSTTDNDTIYFDDAGEYIQWDDGGTDGHRFRISDDVYAGGKLTSETLSAWRIQTVQGPSNSADDQTHQVECSSGYAIVGMSIWASSRLDGYITLVCQYLGDLLDTGSSYWTAGSGTGDDTWHYRLCSSNEVATGFSVYANTYLDHTIKLKCTPMASGVTAPYSMSHWFVSGGAGEESDDDCWHGAMCPTGTFMHGFRVWVGSYLDDDIMFRCRGVQP